MAFQEFHHDFGAVTASTTGQFSLEVTFRGNPNVPARASIPYAVVTNFTNGTVTVNKGFQGESLLQIGQTKRIEFPFGTRFFTVFPSATTSSGQLLADVGLDGVTL